MSSPRRDVFQAISDPTRRAILGLLALQSLSVNAVAENFDISRPAVSKHVKVLEECGLVHVRQEGRERFCEARLDQLAEVNAWVNQYRRFWERKFDRLEAYLDQLQHSKKKHRGKKK